MAIFKNLYGFAPVLVTNPIRISAAGARSSSTAHTKRNCSADRANTTNNCMGTDRGHRGIQGAQTGRSENRRWRSTDSSYVANCFREEWRFLGKEPLAQRRQKVCGDSGAMERAAGAGAAARGAVFPRQRACQPCQQIDKFRRALRKIPRLERRCLQLRGIPICHQDEQPRRRAREHGHRADPSGGRYRDLMQ